MTISEIKAALQKIQVFSKLGRAIRLKIHEDRRVISVKIRNNVIAVIINPTQPQSKNHIEINAILEGKEGFYLVTQALIDAAIMKFEEEVAPPDNAMLLFMQKSKAKKENIVSLFVPNQWQKYTSPTPRKAPFEWFYFGQNDLQTLALWIADVIGSYGFSVFPAQSSNDVIQKPEINFL